MTSREALQLGVAALFPLGLLTALMVALARHHGRTGRQIVLGLAGIVACLGAVVATGLALNARRGGPLFDYSAGSFGLGAFGPLDVLGLAFCALLLVVALRIAKWLTRGDLSPAPLPLPPQDAGPAEEAEQPTTEG